MTKVDSDMKPGGRLKEDPSGRALFLVGFTCTLLLSLCCWSPSWVQGTIEGKEGFAAFEMSLWTFTGTFSCKEPGSRNVFCGGASRLLNGTFPLGEAASKAREHISEDAFASLQMYDRSRWVIFASFFWVLKIMVTAFCPLLWYIFREPDEKYLSTALRLFCSAPLAGLAGLAIWTLLNPGVGKLAFALDGSSRSYTLLHTLTWGHSAYSACVTLIITGTLSMFFSSRLKRDPCEAPLQKAVVKKGDAADEWWARLPGSTCYGAFAPAPTAPGVAASA